jgi:predicted nucleic acid-binding protein
LIESSDVLAHEVVFGEILQGCKNKTELNFILEYWESLSNIVSNGSFIHSGKLAFEDKHLGKGIGIIDSILINEARKKNLKIWTLDKKILKLLEPKHVFEK